MPRVLFFCKRCKWPAWRESKGKGFSESPTCSSPVTDSQRIFRGREVGPFLLFSLLRQKRGGDGGGGGDGQLVPTVWAERVGRTGWQEDGIRLGVERASPAQHAPGGPSPRAGRTRPGRCSGLCVKRRPAPRPGSLPAPPAASPSPLSLSAAAARAGRARGRLRHTLTHTHTARALHLVLLPWRTHRGLRVSWCQRAGQGPPPASPQDRPLASSCYSLGSSTAASFPATGTRPFSHCCSCRDVEAAGGAGQTH